MNLGNISLLVGGNNSGKSTLIKAILLCCDNLRLIKTNTFEDPLNIQGYRFSFDANDWHDVKIKTFARAIYGKMIKSLNKDGKEIRDFAKHIKFCFSINDFTFEIVVEQIFDVEDVFKNKVNDRDIIYGNISYVSIEDRKRGLQFIENYRTGKMSYKIYEKDNTFKSCEFSSEHYLEIPNENLFVHIIGNFLRYSQEKNDNEDNNETRRQLHNVLSYILASKRNLIDIISKIRVEYISIHSVNQNNIYNIEDKNDYIAKVIHAYYNSGIKEGDEMYSWIKEWISKKDDRFNIGDDFTILRLGDSAYQVRIFEEDDIHFLADKGMGTIQIMVLLLRLATIIKDNRLNRNFQYEGKNIKNGLKINVDKVIVPTIIIEEPEQNLHPKIQSVLANFFLDAHKRFGCKFIIETHSEYMIRKSQVLVKKMAQKNNADTNEELKEINPFKVFYFDSKNENIPFYEMEYRIDGNFSNDFGNGFYDESTKLLYDIL